MTLGLCLLSDIDSFVYYDVPFFQVTQKCSCHFRLSAKGISNPPFDKTATKTVVCLAQANMCNFINKQHC